MANLLIDVPNMYSRAFFTAQDDGEHAAVFMSINMLLNLIKRFKPDEIHLCLDGEGLIRRQQYPKYKAHRPDKPDGYDRQLKEFVRLMEYAGLAVYNVYGFEADDVIFTLDKKVEGVYNIVVSADKDLLQLVTPTTRIWQFNRVMNVEDVVRKFGVHPSQMRDYLALCGDTADNVPGVHGIGPKRAATLLNTYASLDNFLKSDGTLVDATIANKVTHESVAESRWLVTLMTIPGLSIPYGMYDEKRIHDSLRVLQ